MQIDLNGQSLRLIGIRHEIAKCLHARLTEQGAIESTDGPPDLLIVSAPLVEDAAFDAQALLAEAQEIGAQMQAKGSGRILFLLSATAGLPMRRAPALSMQMAGLLAAVRVMAMQLAPQVAVNAVGCGAIAEGDSYLSGDAGMLTHASVGRAGTPDEVCHVAMFLCDPDNTYLTGQILSADGGWAAGYGRNF